MSGPAPTRICPVCNTPKVQGSGRLFCRTCNARRQQARRELKYMTKPRKWKVDMKISFLPTFEECLMAKIIPEPMSGCWLWLGTAGPLGYGQIGKNRVKIAAHRAVYELHCGPIPKGMVLCHKCDTPACVNPKHMFVGTQKDNIHDAMRKGRMRGICFEQTKN